MKTVLLIGAGMTRAARPNAALKRCPPLDRDFFQIARRIDKPETNAITKCLTDLVGDYAAELQGSLETTATYLYIKAIDSAPGSAYHTGFVNLLHLLNRVLARTTNEIPTDPPALLYRLLLSELRKLETPTDLSVITFNYDLLIERTLECIALKGRPATFLFPGCYRLDGITRTYSVPRLPKFHSPSLAHDGVAVLKLHGSMNWQSRHRSAVPPPGGLVNPRRAFHVGDFSQIPESLYWKPGARTVYLKPIIVPPVTGKRGIMHQQIQPLWNEAAKRLRESDRIVIVGYSCPPLDLEARILISENLRANSDKKVYVVDRNPESATKFVELCGVDHITVYTDVADWIRDAIP